MWKGRRLEPRALARLVWNQGRPQHQAVRYLELPRRPGVHDRTAVRLATCLSGTQYASCGSGPPAATRDAAMLEDPR